MKRIRIALLSVTAALFLVNCGGGDPELLPLVSIVSNVTVEEGDTGTKEVKFKISCSGELSKDGNPSVDYSVRHVTTTDSDIELSNGTLNFTYDGEVQTVSVTVKSDEVYEVDKEFTFALTNPINARFTSSSKSKTGTLKDDDPCLVGDCEGYLSAESYSGYTLDWSDEFNGTVIDQNIWGYDVGGGGWWNAQLQEFTNGSANSYIENGSLILKAIDVGGNYTSAQLKTQDKKAINKGRLDIRAKFPSGKGVWPRIWLKPNDNVHGWWPTSGEMIMAEIYGHLPNIVHTLADYGNDGNDFVRQPWSYAADDHKYMADVFHVYSLIWEDGRIRCLIDGDEYMSLTRAEVQAQGYVYPYDADFHVIFSMAVGGINVGEPDPAAFPAQMEIDYIRYFKAN